MSIDEKAIDVLYAAKTYRISKEAVTKIIKAYEAAKEAQQPMSKEEVHARTKAIFAADFPNEQPDEKTKTAIFNAITEVCANAPSGSCFFSLLPSQRMAITNAVIAAMSVRESGCQKCDDEMLRVKACEHIAEGEPGWQKLRNTCPSTIAVATLRDNYDLLFGAAKPLFGQWLGYQATCGNHEEAYYKLAKYAYPLWEKLKAALSEIKEGTS